jgi:hypothetical protein
MAAAVSILVALVSVSCASDDAQQPDERYVPGAADQPAADEDAPKGPPSVDVRITMDAVEVRGEQVRGLDDGALGDLEEPFEIPQLRAALKSFGPPAGQEVTGLRTRTLIRVDPMVPYGTLAAVLMTADRIGHTDLSLLIGERPAVPVNRPRLGEGTYDQEGGLNMVAYIGEAGIRLTAAGTILPPIEGCGGADATICLGSEKGPLEVAEQVRRALNEGRRGLAVDRLLRLKSAFNWAAFENQLKEARARAEREGLTDDDTLTLYMHPKMPVALFESVHGVNCAWRTGDECLFPRVRLVTG